MAKIYLSSTYSDLKAHRKAVYDALRKLRHDVIAMEDYVASDERPLQKCLNDVKSCDVYVGIIGWRYGFIPAKNNRQNKSITELEYRQAIKSKIPRPVFLLGRNVRWPKKFRDSETGEGDTGKRIATFRAELEDEQTIDYFRNKDHLASIVGAAVTICLQKVERDFQSTGQKPGMMAHDKLNQLSASQFSAVMFRYGVPRHHIPSNISQNEKAIEVIEYAIQREGEAVEQLIDVISQVAPHLKNR
jgi:hypothetical protein